MLRDRYDNPITTTSQAARDAYIEGVDCILSANHGGVDAFQRAVAADPQFALGHAGLARAFHVLARGGEATQAMADARQLSDTGNGALSEREHSHIAAMDHLIAGQGGAAYQAMIKHLADHPRDSLMAQPCTSVFGLIGFSGLPGREAELLGFMHRLAPYYGDDWWFGSLMAFAQCEVGQMDIALANIEKSLAVNPRNANGAHIRAHVCYERGDTADGYAYIEEWRKDYDKRAPLHCHISWHVALWALEQGDSAAAWRVIETDVMPDAAWGPPINVLTDTASFLLRAEMAGEAPRPEMWQAISAYAQKFFPKPGVAFADVHAALAHAMAGHNESLRKVAEDATGPAGDVVRDMAEAFGAFADENWAEVVARLTPVMASHERIGGSRAQRDLVEFALLSALLKQGHGDEASRLLAMRRPRKAAAHPLAGLH